MNGEAKNETNKAEELFYRTTLNTKFQQDLKAYRKRFDMPENGFKTKEDIERWLRAIEKSRDFKKYPLGYIQEQINILTRHHLPLTLHTLLEEYIWTNNEFKAYPGTPYFGCDIEHPLLPNSKEKMWRESRQPFVKLLIHDKASQKDVVKYIEKNWNLIKTFMKLQGGGQTRISPIRHKGRDEIIFGLHKKPTKVLEKMQKENMPYDYRETLIRRILSQYGIKIEEETIKKVITRQKKLRRGTLKGGH